jgi:hypothetical protein
MSDGVAAIIGAAIGAIATAVGAIVQAVLKNRGDSNQRREARETEHERERRELVRRYLFQLEDAVVSYNGGWRIGLGMEASLGLKTGLRRLFYYHRLALAESLLEQRPEGYRLLMYTEWRRRYEDPSSGLDRLLEPMTASLQRLSPEQDLERLIKSLADIASWLGSATRL